MSLSQASSAVIQGVFRLLRGRGGTRVDLVWRATSLVLQAWMLAFQAAILGRFATGLRNSEENWRFATAILAVLDCGQPKNTAESEGVRCAKLRPPASVDRNATLQIMDQVLSNRSHSALDQFFSRDVEAFRSQLAALECEIAPDAVPEYGDQFHRRTLAAFRESQEACRRFESEHRSSPSLVLEAQTRFRQETEHWFQKSWIANRARTKPGGFAGDCEMLVRLYDEATPARGLGGYLDLCILQLPLARAVRTRLAAAREFLLSEITKSKGGEFRILDIASGPCREYEDWPTPPNGSQVEIVAMDSDPNAIDFVTSKVVGSLGDSSTLNPVRYNALRTRSATATVRKFGKFDLIYSVGLCDYLSDEHLVAMLAGWKDTLRDEGTLYVAFKDTNRYDETPYQWHLDWFFLQRTPEDVVRLYERAGFDTSRLEMTRDSTGIIINVISRQKSARRIRFDSPVSGIKSSGDASSAPSGIES